MVGRIGQRYRSSLSLLIFLTITVGYATVFSVKAQSQALSGTDTERHFVEIPKLNAAQSLTLLAEQTGALFLFPYDIAEAHLASPVKGKYTISEALNVVLENSGLASGLSTDGVIEIYVADNKYNVGERKDMKSNKNILAMMIGLMAGGGIQQATAQEGATAQLEEVVVTARKRAESLQDVPVAVDAFSETKIEEAGITSMRDYIGLSPNISIVESQNTGFAFVNIRGLSQVRNVDPTVAVVVDGVLATTPLGFSQDLYDVQQIEVLKGPQGALYGRNATGGAINITTKQPSDEVEGYVRGGVGNGGSKSVSASLSGPLVENKLLGRMSVSYKDADGWSDNVLLNKEYDPYEDLSITTKLLWMPNDELTVDLRYAHSTTESKGSGFAVCSANFVSTGFPSMAHLAGNGNATPLAGLPASIATQLCDPNNTSVQPQGNVEGFDEREVNTFSLKMDWESDFGVFTSTTSYDKLDQVTVGEQFPYYPYFEIPPGPAALASLNASFGQNRFHEAFSQEFRFTSPSDQRLRWIAGAYYVQTELTTMIAVNTDTNQGFEVQGTGVNIGGVNPTASWNSRFLAAAVPALGGSFGAGVAANPNTNPDALSYNLDYNDNSAYALFAQLNYDVTDTLELSFALRYDRDERKLTVKTPDEYLPVFDFTSASQGDVRTKDYDSLQPKLTLRWKPTDDTTLYTTYAKGFRSGGFNLSGVSGGVATLRNAGVPGMPFGLDDSWEQEDTQSFELGYKSTLLDGRLKLNAATFFTTIDDAFTFNFVAPFVAQTIRNIDEAEILGLEFNASWLPTDNLTVDVGMGILDTEITEISWVGAGGISVKGNELPLNPDSTFNLGITYNFELSGDWAGFIRTDYQRLGDTWFYPENFASRDPINLVNLNLGLVNETTGWEITIWGKNVTDELYVSEAVQPPGVHFYSKPLQMGVNLTKRF